MTRDAIVDEVIAHASSDWLDFGWVVSIVMRVTGASQADSVEPALEVLRDIAGAGLVELGDVTDEGSARGACPSTTRWRASSRRCVR